LVIAENAEKVEITDKCNVAEYLGVKV